MWLDLGWLNIKLMIVQACLNTVTTEIAVVMFAQLSVLEIISWDCLMSHIFAYSLITKLLCTYGRCRQFFLAKKASFENDLTRELSAKVTEKILLILKSVSCLSF